MTTEKGITKRIESYLPSPISKNQAMYLLKTVWPDAPEVDIIKAAIICHQYALNPLMRQLYLIKYGSDWVAVLGIKATRQIAQQALKREGRTYTFKDGPRVMTEKEQIAIRGQVEADKFWAITILEDSDGNRFPGYGSWPRAKKVYGDDKGNDALNMAFIRSERNATDKMAPGALPDIEVADDTYIKGDYKVAIEKGQEEFNEKVDAEINLLYGEDLSHTATASKWQQDKQGEGEKTKEVESPLQTNLSAPLFKNPGEFYTACLQTFKLSKSQVDKEIPGFDLARAEDRSNAWRQIVEVYIDKKAE